MRVLDLSHTITAGMPVYPGTPPPVLQPSNTVERDGFGETLIRMGSHTGTHMDAPAHMVPGAPTLDQFDADRFVAPACVIDVAGAGHEVVGRDVLEAHADLVAGCRFVLLHTGWARYWNDERYLDHFPVLSKDAARWLTTRGLSGVGVDAISVDPVARGVAARFEGSEFANHVEFFRAGLVLVENLTGLDALLRRRFQFICLPLKFERADGSPVRAAAVLE